MDAESLRLKNAQKEFEKMDPPGPLRNPFKRRFRMQELAWGEEPGPMLPGSEFEVAYNAGVKAREGRGL